MLTEVKEYLRLDVVDTEEDTFLLSLVDVAKTYVKNATGKTVNEANATHKLAVLMLVTHWYENRNSVIIGQITKSLEYSLKSILFQMEWSD
jgi:uncharacterized phage protein (predicted DNA packaging)